MDQIDKIVDVVITRQTSTPTMASFAEHLVVDAFDAEGITDRFDASHRVHSYGSLSELADAGFPTTGYVYRAAQAQYSQSPHIKTIYVGWKDKEESWTEALNAIYAENHAWYAVSVSTRRMAEQQLVATWIQSNEKLCILASGDPAVVDEETGDIGAWIKAQRIDRVAVMYHPDCDDTKVTNYTVYSSDGITFYTDVALENPAVIPEGIVPTLVSGQEYTYSVTTYELNENDPIPEACWFGKMLVKQPGSATWALKTLQAIGVYDLGGAQVTKCRNKNVNTYLSASGISITQEGKTGGEYIDVIHGCDWLKARIQNLVFGVLANNDKVPYTDAGVQMIVAPLKQALDEAVKYGILASYEVEYPAVADVSNTDKGNRFLPDVKFTGVLAGAIQSTRIDGTITL